MPRAMLLDAGVTLQDLAYYNFTGAHDEVAKAILRGEFAAGGLMEDLKVVPPIALTKNCTGVIVAAANQLFGNGLFGI